MKVQKALHFHEEKAKRYPKHVGHKYCMFEKYDGWYGYADICGEAPIIIMSRAGRMIPSMVHLNSELQLRFPHCHGRLIFEIIIPGMEFAELNGVLNRKYETANDAILMVHDFIPTSTPKQTFFTRYYEAKEMVLKAKCKQIKIAPMLGVSDEERDWRSEVDQLWAVGKEGLILKRRDAPYGAAVRNYDLMKIKEELTVDLLVIGVERGMGKYEDILGALTVQDNKGNNHSVSGMTDIERQVWWNDPKQIIGKIVEIKAMKWLPDGQLREPRFIGIRHDKLSHEID